jgi:hypothetical protein
MVRDLLGAFLLVAKEWGYNLFKGFYFILFLKSLAQSCLILRGEKKGLKSPYLDQRLLHFANIPTFFFFFFKLKFKLLLF